MTQETTVRINGLSTVSVPTTDHDRAIEFYVGTLGFEVRRDATFGPGMRWVEVAPAGSTTTVALAPPGDVKPGVDTGIRLTTTDAAADHADLQAAGVQVDPEILSFPGVPPMFGFHDPDGNRLYVVQTA
jgi:predicted enzyme related to lactoylglutathione lyase